MVTRTASAALAVTMPRIKHIVLLPHAQCGGIRTFVDKSEPLTPGKAVTWDESSLVADYEIPCCDMRSADQQVAGKLCDRRIFCLQ